MDDPKVLKGKFKEALLYVARNEAMKLIKTQQKNAYRKNSPGLYKPGEETILEITLKHEVIGYCRQEWILELPDNRNVLIIANILSLSHEEISPVSMYLQPSLRFKPTFIGEMDPPAQLFWLYNNTHLTPSYVLDKAALREAVPFCCKTFECLNPHGIIPPFSSFPLMFLFKPVELNYYTAEILLCTNTDTPTRFTFQGQCIPFREPCKDLIIEKTVPKKPIINNPEIALIPSVNIIDIKPFPTFTETHRIFFVKNISETEAWAFQWHTVKFNEILKARVEPSIGLIHPGKSAIMKVIVESLSQPADIAFSIPCDTVDFTKLKKYEASSQLRQSLEEKLKDHFAIPENAPQHQKNPAVKKIEKPNLQHLFITVNTSVVSFRYIDQKLTVEQQLGLKSGKEIQYKAIEKPVLSQEERIKIFEVMEKITWLTLNSNSFQHTLGKISEMEPMTYSQMVPRSKKEDEEFRKILELTPSDNLIQRFLENSLLEILNNQFNQLNEK